MPRVPFLDLNKMAPEDQAKVRSVLGPSTEFRRPFSVLLHSPEGAARYLHLSNYNREASTIDPRTRELVILVVAIGWSSEYIWEAHAAAARRLGVDDDVIAAIRDNKVPPELTKEAPYLRFAQELVQHRKIADATFEAVRKIAGDRGAVDLTLLIGYYTMQAHTLAALEVEREAVR